MVERRPPDVLLLASRATLPDLGVRLSRQGVRLRRVEVVVPIPAPRLAVRRRLERFGPFDTMVVTSKASVDPLVRAFPPTRAFTGEVWAVGPETAAALARAGMRRIRQAPGGGAEGLRRALRGRSRRIVHPRSSRAGPGLSRELVGDGHVVLDLIVYRIRPGPALDQRGQRAVRSARVVVATSPSAISHLRRMVDRATFRHLARSARWVVLGPRTAAAARGHGLARVGVAPSASLQRFTPYLLGVLAHATN